MKRLGMLPHRNRTRRGTTVVETALVLPVFLLFVLGLIELGHALMVKNVLRSACRQAARIGSTEGNTTAEVKQRVLDMIGSAVNAPTWSRCTSKTPARSTAARPGHRRRVARSAARPSSSTDAEPRQLFMVRAKVQLQRHRHRAEYSVSRLVSWTTSRSKAKRSCATSNAASSTVENLAMRTSQRKQFCNANDRRGVVAVEFAIVAPILVAIVFGMIELGRAFEMQNLLDVAAREGARFASMDRDGMLAPGETRQPEADRGREELPGLERHSARTRSPSRSRTSKIRPRTSTSTIRPTT